MPAWGDVLREFLADEGEVRLPAPVLPGYRILRRLAEHGQSEVFLAEDDAGRPLAIKRWRAPSPRAARELEALVELAHPGVVRVHAGLEDEGLGLPCLVMDYVEGERLLADGARLPARAARRALGQVAAALAHVHARGRVHRDVKPANLLLRPDGGVVLIDFGLVTAGPEPREEPVTGARPVGTLPYMAPEQLGLVPAPVGSAADVYGWGATLYQALTGAVPFETNGAYERRGRDVWRDPAQGAEVRGVPADLRALVTRCLAFDPAQRPRDGRALLEALAVRAPRRRGTGGAVVLALGLAGACAALLLGGAPPERTWVLQPGPAQGRDAEVQNVGLYRNDNYGAAQHLRVGFRPAASGQGGEYRGFLAFDLTALPPDAELRAATLELYCTHSEYGPGPRRVELREVVPSADGRTPWVEGTGLLDGVLDGVAWDGAFDPLFPGGASRRPELSAPDVGATLATVEAPPGFGPGWLRWDVTAVARRWLRDSRTNLGLRLAAADPASGAWSFATSDHPHADWRPRLVLRTSGAAPRPTPTETPREVARPWLEGAQSLLRAGNPDGAFAALSEACRADPGWGRAYRARAEVARALGLTPVRWLDSERATIAADPDLSPEALLEFADAWAQREGGSPEALAALAAVIASLDADTAQDADAVLVRALAPPGLVAADLARPEYRALLSERLVQLEAAAERARGTRGAEAVQVVAAAFDGDPRALTPAVARRLWLLRGEVERARASLTPDDPDRARLAPLWD